MKNRNFAHIFLLMIPLLSGSCVALNSHQSGRTLGKGKLSVLGSANYGRIDSEEYNKLSDDSATFFIAEVGALYGLRENLDVGLKINSSTYITTLVKYQILGDKRSAYASSVGAELGVSLISAAFGAFGYGGGVSWYNSYHFSDNFALTLAPRYNYLGFYSYANPDEKIRRENHLFGYSAGFIVGSKHQFSVEASQFVVSKRFSFNSPLIFSAAYIFNF